MALDVVVSLSQSTYDRIKQWAVFNHQDVETAIAEYLDKNLPSLEELLFRQQSQTWPLNENEWLI